jgi:hypothetical protein
MKNRNFMLKRPQLPTMGIPILQVRLISRPCLYCGERGSIGNPFLGVEISPSKGKSRKEVVPTANDKWSILLLESNGCGH